LRLRRASASYASRSIVIVFTAMHLSCTYQPARVKVPAAPKPPQRLVGCRPKTARQAGWAAGNPQSSLTAVTTGNVQEHLYLRGNTPTHDRTYSSRDRPYLPARDPIAVAARSGAAYYKVTNPET
jgi:hypothetical protein